MMEFSLEMTSWIDCFDCPEENVEENDRDDSDLELLIVPPAKKVKEPHSCSLLETHLVHCGSLATRVLPAIRLVKSLNDRVAQLPLCDSVLTIAWS